MLRRYWGFVALFFALGGWVEIVAGQLAASAAIGVILALSVAGLAYFTFRAPLWCGAETREGLACRKNSRGLLLGCDLRQHKWQRLKLAAHVRTWREFNGKLWASARDSAATLGGIASVVSAVAAVVALMIR